MKNDNVSIAKGIGICLVVLSHTQVPTILGNFLSLFFLPLFFSLSGYFVREKNAKEIPQFLLRRVKGLYLPFVLWSFSFLLFQNIFVRFGFIGKENEINSVSDFFMQFIIILKMSGTLPLLGPFWFLRVLFWISVMSILSFSLGLRIFKKRIIISCLLIFIFFLSECVFLFFGFKKPCGIDKIMLFGFISYWIGNVYNYYEYKVSYKSIYLFISIIVVLTGAIFSPMYLHNLSLNNLVYYTLISTVGLYMTLNFSSHVKGVLRKLFVFIGENTLIIFALHFLVFRVINFFFIKIYDLPVSELSRLNISERTFDWIVYLFFGVSFPLLIKWGYINIKKMWNARVDIL